MASNDHHTINYIEFYAVDLAEATRFYGAAFGWQFTEYGTDYVGIRNRDKDGECGGICRTDKVVPGGPLVILYSADLESSLACVQKAGGKITRESSLFQADDDSISPTPAAMNLLCGPIRSLLRNDHRSAGLPIAPESRTSRRAPSIWPVVDLLAPQAATPNSQIHP